MNRYVLVGSMLVWGSCCLGADWPRWRGPDGTGHVRPGVAVPERLPNEAKVLWRVAVGNGHASPVVAGGRVFHLDNQRGKEVVHALDAATGKALWSATLDDAFKDHQSASGPRCTPVVDDDRLYVQSCRGEFQCLRVADGQVAWRVNFVKDFRAVFIGEKGRAIGASRHGYTGSAVVDGEKIFVGVGGSDGAGVVAFDKRTGKVIWKSQDDMPAYASLVVATIGGIKQVVFFASEALIGLDASDGRRLWRVGIRTALGRHVTTPVVAGNMVLVASHQAGLMAVKVSKQGDAFTAEQAWVDKGSPINFSSPVVVDGHLYGLGRGRTLLCTDVRTGKKAWAEKSFFSGMVRRGYASFLVMGKNLLILAESGHLLLVAADPAQCRRLGKLQVCGQNWCHPAYADGKVFVRDDKELRCVPLLP